MAGSDRNNHDLPFARELFEAADRLRGSVESAEYKHLVLGLLFLKYISDSFERRRAWLDAATRDPQNRVYRCAEEDDRRAILEDRDEYISENVLWVPEQALAVAPRRRLARRHWRAGRPCPRRDRTRQHGATPRRAPEDL